MEILEGCKVLEKFKECETMRKQDNNAGSTGFHG